MTTNYTTETLMVMLFNIKTLKNINNTLFLCFYFIDVSEDKTRSNKIMLFYNLNYLHNIN